MAEVDAQFQAAKSVLLQTSTDSKLNLYDHLTECISRVLDERPNNAADLLEDISRTIKKEKLQLKTDTLVDEQEPTAEVDLAVKQKSLYEKSAADEDTEVDEEVGVPFPNLQESAHYFEMGGIGISKEECSRVLLSLKKLTVTEPLSTVRFWGKVFGLEANYYIAEAEYQEGEGEEEEEDTPQQEQSQEDDQQDDADEDGEGKQEDVLPKPDWKPPPTIPKEANKTGTNKKTYFVCNEPDGNWTKLPSITPVQITHAREIRKLCTGRLDAPVTSFPPFPGEECHYLRAQIARISATTQISPTNYYMFDEEDEADDDEAVRDSYIVNPDFDGLRAAELADDSLTNWCHHVQYILPQGRCTWFNPVQKAEDEFEDEEDEEEKEQPEEPEPEIGPQLLTSISEDDKVDHMPAWSCRLSSGLVPQYAIAIVSSNLWPGAHTFGFNKTFENVYIGWGLKYQSGSFNPQLPPTVQEEFPAGADITEAVDPTVEQEQALWAAQKEAQEQQEEEEEPDEEDDDD
ncbi:radial spoke head protein 6 homolog A-like [Dysidea avara]|uniref:radial spoke head protein 6 homolog A-like n=1 Tax=Dysidea avara TaxID=196820 RepID=UPI00332E34CC